MKTDATPVTFTLNRQKTRWNLLITNVILIVVSIIWLMPLIMTVLLSVRPKKDTLGTGNIFFGSGFSLEWFQSAFDSQPWGTYYLTTIIFVFGLLALQLITITLSGYAFARLDFFGRDFIFILILVQIMIPSAVLLVPNFATVRFLNLYDTKLALMLPYIGSAFGTFLMRQTFRQIPRELEDAARIDGCNWLGLLRHVYIPSSISGYIAFSLASVSAHWNEFLWPLIITRSDDNRVLTVGLGQILRSESGAQYGLIGAGTLIVVTPLLLLFIIFQRQFINSFLRSGMK
ncbi:carbohydrate ABC transporter permease [Candidatus Chlorohelix allophototropha]|uniref:Carbohydrate ABC transporter permease n=1 Tax=Candidatus Chlorohelix allophototropha TaxID=3003348 RepID=A0ABY9AXM1_9CHLR|nr:carbohydrate ABC transporter permease [Chloroflexota bacterium L227-S17]